MPCSAAPPRMRTGGRPSSVSILRAHRAQRLRHALHRAPHQRRSRRPVHVSNGCAASRPMNSRIAVPALPMSSTPCGAAQAVAGRRRRRSPRRGGTLHGDAEPGHRLQRRQAVLALEKAGDVGAYRTRSRRTSARDAKWTCRPARATVLPPARPVRRRIGPWSEDGARIGAEHPAQRGLALQLAERRGERLARRRALRRR